MKTNVALLVLVGSFTLLIANVTFADCGQGSCGDDETYSSCGDSESPCACTDPGYRYNYCMSKSRYCAAFGNDGAI